jgi:hypothetical protein
VTDRSLNCPTCARLLAAIGNPPRVFGSGEGHVTHLTQTEVARAVAAINPPKAAVLA